MNKEDKKKEINSQRMIFLKKIASLSQIEVNRCYDEINNAISQDELNNIKFNNPSIE